MKRLAAEDTKPFNHDQMKLPLPPLKLALTTSLTLLGFSPVQALPIKPVIAQHSTFNSSGQFNERLIFNTPPPPDDINAPSNRVGGGKRGCENTEKLLTGKEKQLTALVPFYQSKDSGLALGLTTSSHPTFWFYVPYSPTLKAEFVLQNTAGQTIYRTTASLSRTPGVVSFSLPPTTSPLEVDKRYHWYFNIYCNPQQPPVFVDGWIQRKELNSALKNQLETATPKQRVALFASQGIWYEALSAAAELRRTDPKGSDWVALLQAIGLAEVASEPMVEAVTLELTSRRSK